MLEKAVAVEFVRRATSGRTGPLILTCETAAGEAIELFCKLSAGCDEGVTNLAREVVGACLAADLGLPVPKPFLIELSQRFIGAVSDSKTARRMRESAPVAFGSTRVPNQFSVWTTATPISDVLLPKAAAIFVFDAIIQNPDRRDSNPNCLVKGDEIRIIDHELAFFSGPIIGWKPPWVLGGLRSLEDPGHHIFREGLRGRAIDFEPIIASWSDLSDQRIREYQGAIPGEWATARSALDNAVRLISDARDNINGCIAEVRRVLE